MDKPIVTIAGCSKYHEEELNTAVKKILEPFGGIRSIVAPGKKVLLKPNLLAAATVSEAVTTHPMLIKVLTDLINTAGGQVFVGDSPGNDKQAEALKSSGIQQVIDETEADVLPFKEISYKKVNGFKERSIPLAAELDEIDLIFNVAKLKTHALTGLTGAVKNVYGCIPGNFKKRYHLEHPLPLDFSRLLIDIYLAVKPAFSIIDAVIGMEGPGPRKGKPKQIGLLMASPNGIALDSVAAEITGFKPEQVTTIAAARELKLSGSNLADIEIRGLSLEQSRVKDFDRGPAGSGKVSRMIASFPISYIRNMLYARRPYPVVFSGECTSCGICAEVCPAQVIELKLGIPDIDQYECIRCYCCQEHCAQGAIKVNGK
ncbi:MAG: DUF362 domain-containing protein [Bacillota bacterium]|nr:DUF362 domain-containing protein [Bacillota bacterium]